MKKKENKTLSLSTERALKRVKIILPLTDEALNKKERIILQKEIALKTGKSYRTLSRWYNAYKLFGLDGLIGEGNGREGKRVLSEKVLEEAIKLRKELPSRSVRDIITILEEESLVERGKAKIPTVQRYLQNEGFSKKEMRSRVYGSDISSFRFQKRHRMYMLEADIKYGPCIYPKGRVRGIKTYFFGWIDDYSRLVLNGKFYLKQDEETLLSSFRGVIEEYGVCVKVYCDNGSQYISSALSNTCSMLGIILLHAKVRSPESKGKIERFKKMLILFAKKQGLNTFLL